jgi:hypothetical protein
MQLFSFTAYATESDNHHLPMFMLRIGAMQGLKIQMHKCALDVMQLLNLVLKRLSNVVCLLQWLEK